MDLSLRKLDKEFTDKLNRVSREVIMIFAREGVGPDNDGLAVMATINAQMISNIQRQIEVSAEDVMSIIARNALAIIESFHEGNIVENIEVKE